MNNEEKARRLVDDLQTVVEKARAADKASEELSPQELRVLRAVGRCDCPIMGVIASAISLSLSSVTGLIDRLCEKKLVKRDRACGDRRQVQVELTAEGRAAHQAALEAQLSLARGLLKGLSAAEQDDLVRLFGKAAQNLKGE